MIYNKKSENNLIRLRRVRYNTSTCSEKKSIKTNAQL